MAPPKSFGIDYFSRLEKRAKKSRVFHRYQQIGLEIAEILGDRGHKTLYIKLAKQGDPDRLLALAKNVSDRPKVKNKGAYFMKIISEKNGARTAK